MPPETVAATTFAIPASLCTLPPPLDLCLAPHLIPRYNKCIGALAQLGERKVRNLEVRGSIPLCSTTYQTETAFRFKVFQTVSPCGVCGFQDSLKRSRPFLFLRLFCQLFANFSKISMRKICQLFLKPGGRFLSRVAAFFADFFKGHWAKVANFFTRSFFPDIRLTVPSFLA